MCFFIFIIVFVFVSGYCLFVERENTKSCECEGREDMRRIGGGGKSMVKIYFTEKMSIKK